MLAGRAIAIIYDQETGRLFDGLLSGHGRQS